MSTNDDQGGEEHEPIRALIGWAAFLSGLTFMLFTCVGQS